MITPRRAILGLLPLVAGVFGFWHFLVAPTRAETVRVRVQLISAVAARDAAIAEADAAQQARTHYPTDYATLVRLADAVPVDEDAAGLVRGLDAVARASEIDLRAIALSVPVADAPPAPAAGAAPAARAGTEGAAGGTAEGAPRGAAGEGAAAPAGEAGATAPAQAPPGAAVGAAGLLTMPFTFTADGGYLAVQRFLKVLHARAGHASGRIRVDGRLLTIDGFSFAAGREGFPQIKAMVSATAYLEPDPSGVITGATAQAPATAAPAAAPRAPVAPVTRSPAP